MANIDTTNSVLEPSTKDAASIPKDLVIPSTEPESLGLVSQTIALTVNESHSQLSAPQTNTPEQQHIPREIISSKISTTRLQAELQRPLLVGTYQDKPAYLLKLQFQFIVPKGSQNWLRRIQTASIGVTFESALMGAVVQKPRHRRQARQDASAKHPTIVKTFPGSEGWEGPVCSRLISNEVALGLQAGWSGLGTDISWSQSNSRDETGTVKVDSMRTGAQRNNLLISIAENPITSSGIPGYMVFPLIVVHHSTRFSMRVTVKATYGFWQGKLAESVPVLGRADEPLFFDPVVLEESLQTGSRNIDGVKVIEHTGELEEVNLQLYSSLR